MSDEPDGGADDATAEGAGPEPTGSKLAEIMATRRDKVARLREAGVDPYPPDFEPTHTLGAVRRRWHDLEAGEETGEEVTVAGRVTAHRDLGSLAFLELLEDGEELQLFVADDTLDEPSRSLLGELDVGDWLGATGEVMASRQGELSVRPDRLVLLSKSLRPLPDQFYGLSDVEQRYRRRELDLVVNDDSRRVFEIRTTVMRALRSEMEERGFVEVETPMLHPIPGGAAARPFVTHHNTLDADLYLRVAPELYLKRLVAGGFPRVFELNRSFRNEGMSRRHNPEFTMLESYQAYGDHHDVMDLTEALLVRAAQEALDTTTLTYDGRELSLDPPFARRPMLELVAEATGESDLAPDTPAGQLVALCGDHDVDVDPDWGPGRLIEALYEGLVEDDLWEPTFVTDHPLETSPLARRHRDKPGVAERFELVAGGHELANAFSELTDPDDQRQRFKAQAEAGDDDAAIVDEPYLRAMELGLPPTGGLGLGIDRLVMLLADVDNIRDVIFFPTLRPE